MPIDRANLGGKEKEVEMGPRTNQMGPRRVEGEDDLRR
jgi:hypothetical protein